MRGLASVVAVIGVVLAGCGSDGGGSSDADSSSASAVPAASDAADVVQDGTAAAGSESDAPETRDVEADMAAAEAALLTLSDFPAGWSETPSDEDSGDDELDRQVGECFGSDGDGLFDGDAQAETGDFVSPNGGEVSQTVGISPTVEEAMAVVAAARGEGVTACLTEVYNGRFVELLQEEAGSEVEVGEVSVGALNVSPVGDEVGALRVTIPLSANGFTVDLVADQVLTRVGRSLSGLQFVSESGPAPIETIDEYNAVAAAKLPG